jgi:hypothetical protein
MLKSIDILISLAVVMLVASMAVTVMTGWVTHFRNSRGRNLQQGLADLLVLLNSDFTKEVASKIAATLLTHPLIRDKEDRMGSVIHREEFTKLLMELAAGNGPQRLEPAIQAELQKTLAANGIDDPAKTLENIRAVALQLEKSNPEFSTTVRTNLAILQGAESHLVAKINSWFDQTMDRVSQRFTFSTRTVTFVCGLLLAGVLQLDSIALVNRISVDDALREALVNQAKTISAQAAQGTEQSRDLYSSVINQGVIAIPSYPGDLQKFADLRHLTGILFTTLLLSLGAPFWYGALQQLLQLRSKIAQQDDVQRKERQVTQPAA